jgi:hypothetical protein
MNILPGALNLVDVSGLDSNLLVRFSFTKKYGAVLLSVTTESCRSSLQARNQGGLMGLKTPF